MFVLANFEYDNELTKSLLLFNSSKLTIIINIYSFFNKKVSILVILT